MYPLLIVVDNPRIHEAFRDVLGWLDPREEELAELEQELFGEENPARSDDPYALTFATRGDDAIVRAEEACDAGTPFAAAFIDLDLPDRDGVQVARRILTLDPDLLVVLMCDGEDPRGNEARALLGRTRVFLVRKPLQYVCLRGLARAMIAYSIVLRCVGRTTLAPVRRRSSSWRSMPGWAKTQADEP